MSMNPSQATIPGGSANLAPGMQHSSMATQPGPIAGGPPPTTPQGAGQAAVSQGQAHSTTSQASGAQGLPAEQPKLDNISKAKTLVPQLKDSLADVFKVAAITINGNHQIDGGSKPADVDPGRFDRSLEKFFSLCDQLELQLKTSIECVGQELNSKRYLATPVTPAKLDGSLTYPQYVNIVQGQIAYAKEVHATLVDAATKLSVDV